ncbi:MAG: DNA replication and repair protein RecF [Thermoleophilia bacterium]
MFVSALRLVNFRSYCDAGVRFSAGLNVVVGENAAGKTNLLEGAWFALRGASPRTRREEKLITWGERFARVELELGGSSGPLQTVAVGFAPGQGKRVRWNGAEVTSLDDLRGRCQVFIFVPESLLLVKGSPARRRAHLDAFAAALDPQYFAAARDLQAALRQRNAQLVAVKHGAAAAALDPWDAQFARAAAALGLRRRDLVAELHGRFAATATALAPARGSFSLQLVSQLTAVDYDEAALLDELRVRRPGETARGLTLFGPHRDDLRFLEVAAGSDGGGSSGPLGEPRPITGGARPPASSAAGRPVGPVCGPVDLPRGGRDLRLFGSQGEQRAAVLALLLAEQELAAERTGEQGMLFLDDVMSELDDARRRLLVRRLAAAGQAIITTTNRHYFTADELAEATVIELPLDGSVGAGDALPTADAAGPAAPALDAL